jgi:hypothetical protein
VTETRAASRSLITREAVLAAIAEYDAMGRDAFLACNGFRKSTRFHLVHEGRFYDSKAILGVAYGHAFDCEALRPSEFSGGAAHCERIFTALGFEVAYGTRLGAKVKRLARKAAKAVLGVLRVGLVSCTKSKLGHEGDGQTYAARDLYSPSWNFRQSVAFVERECDEWLILSAEHGAVDPDEALAHYNRSLYDAKKSERREWAARVVDQLRARFGNRRVEFVALAGAPYVEGLTADFAVEEPMAGLFTGQRKAWLKANGAG